MLDIAIIGGGLAGLSLAHSLQGGQRSIAVFEARARFGGRILSLPGAQPFRHDFGPSWIWPELQPRLTSFIAQHGLEIYPQWCDGISFYQTERSQTPQAYLDQGTYASARRIQGGAYRLIEVLLQSLPLSILKSEHPLREVVDRGDHVELRFADQYSRISVQARQVVLTIPPRLLANSVKFSPTLDTPLRELMCATPTWMAGHAKALIRYERPFWREAGLSGGALAVYQGAALAEIFDACASDGSYAALSGFMALPVALRRQYRQDLEALILEQLVRLFGKEAAQPQAIQIQDWCDESFTASVEDEQLPAGHPQYGHAWLQLDHWNDKLFFSGTETAAKYGGYLEGALEASERVLNSLMMHELYQL
jgi:monoamine oxidase